MNKIYWDRFPLISNCEWASRWLLLQKNLGLAQSTIDAYGRALEIYLNFCAQEKIEANLAKRDQIALYVNFLKGSPNSSQEFNSQNNEPKIMLSNATIQQRITVIRLFYDYLVEEGVRSINPVGRGSFLLGPYRYQTQHRGLVPRIYKLPWIPNEEQWSAILNATKQESIRNKMMLSLAYDAALRREELCLVKTTDFDPSHRTLRIRAETTKGKRERILVYSGTTGKLLHQYLHHRQTISRIRGSLFLSESPRNFGKPISKWTWSKVIRQIALRAGVPQFSTHTLRHLCLTDLARSGWDLHMIATFAGHRNLTTTMQYIHLSGRDLAEKMANGMTQIHAWRIEMLANL